MHIAAIKKLKSFVDAESLLDEQVVAVDWRQAEHRLDDAIDLQYALNTLPTRHHMILRFRYQEGMTCSEIGKMVGICPARARAIIGKSLRMLKHPSRGLCYGRRS